MDYSYDADVRVYGGQAARLNEQVSDFRTTSRFGANAKPKQTLDDLRITGSCGDIGGDVTATG